MSKSEIEDVLSSIRRLVTEEQLQQQRHVARSSDKLVLTPALRIETALPEVGQTLPVAGPVTPVPEQKGDASASAAHQAAAALEAALVGRGDDWEPEGTELLPSLRLSMNWDFPADSEAADVTGPAGAVPVGWKPADHRPAPAEAPVPAEAPFQAEELIPDQAPAGVEALILAEAPVPAEPLLPAEAPVPAEAPAALAVDITPEENINWDEYLAVHRYAPLMAAEQAEPWRPAPDPREKPPADLSGSFGIADAARGQWATGAGPEPVPQVLPQSALPPSGPVQDASGQADGDRPATLPSDRLADQAVPDHPPEDGPSAPPAGQDLAPGIDEAQLRDLIRDVLREELHGELGQRITRNVRKLVRAELARALTVRDLT